MSKKSFILFLDNLKVLNDLTDEQAGQLFKAIYLYQTENKIELEGLLKAVFVSFQNALDENNKKYDETVERNKKNGIKGGRPKKTENPKNPSGFFKNQSGFSKNPKNLDTDTDTDTDTVTDIKDKNNVYGECVNVHLTRTHYSKLLNEILSEKVLKELIDELSLNIARGKAPPYSEEQPDCHYACLKVYWRNRKLKAERPPTQEDRAAEFRRKLQELSNAKRIEEARSG